MATGMMMVRRMLVATSMAIGVPMAVVTCQGSTVLDQPGDAELSANAGGASSTGIGTSNAGGASSLATASTMMGMGGATPVTQPTYGGAALTTGSTLFDRGGANSNPEAWPTDAGAPRVFLGKYPEPAQQQGTYFVPAPPATATVGRPCEARQDVCAGGQSRDAWAKNVIAACMAETSSGGCVDFIFDKGMSCSKYVVFWHGATKDMGRCVATVDYYESCSGTDNGGSNISVYSYGADCSPLN